MTSDGPKTTAPTSEACPQSRPEPSEVTLWTSDVPSDEEAQPRRRRRRGSVSKDDIPDDYDDTYGPSGIGALTSRPHFFPPLWLARRTACLRLLRAENVRSIADLGCGSGSLPSMLVQPAWHRDDFPDLYPPTTGETDAVSDEYRAPTTVMSAGSHPHLEQSVAEKMQILRQVPRVRPEENELHLSRVIGIDCDRTTCEAAAKVVDPASSAQGLFAGGPGEARWEDLRVEVYEGAIEVFNDALQEVEAIVLTEVIEHLSEAALAKLPSVLFSLYSPRLVVITTPNHAFNPYFVRPAKAKPASPDSDEAQGEEAHLFPDPTGRTKRVFRDARHTLEWTPEEFRAWCDEVVATHAGDCEVEMSGVGSLASYYGTPLGHDIAFPPPALDLHPELAEHPACTAVPSAPQEFFATQIAVFRRQYSGVAERSSRSARPTPLPFFSPSSETVPDPTTSPGASTGASRSPSKKHDLVISAVHPSDPRTHDPPPALASLRRAIKAVFLANRSGDELALSDLWRIGRDPEIDLRRLAQGQVGRVVDALVGCATASLEALDGPEDANTEEEEQDDQRGAGRFVLAVDQDHKGLGALRVRWLDYDEALEAHEAAVDRLEQQQQQQRERLDEEWSVEEAEPQPAGRDEAGNGAGVPAAVTTGVDGESESLHADQQGALHDAEAHSRMTSLQADPADSADSAASPLGNVGEEAPRGATTGWDEDEW